MNIKDIVAELQHESLNVMRRFVDVFASMVNQVQNAQMHRLEEARKENLAGPVAGQPKRKVPFVPETLKVKSNEKIAGDFDPDDNQKTPRPR